MRKMKMKKRSKENEEAVATDPSRNWQTTGSESNADDYLQQQIKVAE